MKILEILRRVNKSDEFKLYADIYDLAEKVFNIYDIKNDDTNRLTCYFLASWYCTDSHVGLRVYFLDDLIVAVSYQPGRKSDEEFYWVSESRYKLVKKYILSLREEEEDDFKLIDMMDRDFGDCFYKICYNSQLFKYHYDIPLYQGNKVKIIKLVKEGDKEFDPKCKHLEDWVIIQFEDEIQKLVKLEELDFPYNMV